MDTDAISAAITDVTERIILPRFRRLEPGEIEAKRPGDLVTIADREAEAELTAILRAAHPAALIVGEEATFENPGVLGGLADADHAWLIDPVDGTGNFTRGTDDFGVMVAELRGGETVRSWIWQPRHRRLYVAELGAGVVCNGVPLPKLTEPTGEVRGRVPRRMRRRPVAGYRLSHTWSACALDYPALASGEIDLLGYVKRHHNAWDHAPGSLMVHEVGGLCAIEGVPYRANADGQILLCGRTPQTTARAANDLVTDDVRRD